MKLFNEFVHLSLRKSLSKSGSLFLGHTIADHMSHFPFLANSCLCFIVGYWHNCVTNHITAMCVGKITFTIMKHAI